jgi:aldehyde:ferredoxin oxidoreductase
MLASLGWNLSLQEYESLGTRTWNLVRLFNLREGWTAADDYLPRAIAKPLEDSKKGLAPEVFAQMLSDYYLVRRWDEAGRPSTELLAELGLEIYAD